LAMAGYVIKKNQEKKRAELARKLAYEAESKNRD